MIKTFILKIIELMFRLLAKVEFEGIENVPLTGRCILTMNHAGHPDGPLMIYLQEQIAREDFYFIVGERWEKHPIIGWAVRNLGYSFVDRYNADIKAVKNMIRALNAEQVVVIAPEGERTHDEKLKKPKHGPAYLAAKTNSPIIPVALSGTRNSLLFPAWKKFKRVPIKVTIGKPYTIPELPKKNRSKFLGFHSEEIICRIAAMLPEDYQGVYSAHPRVIELMKS